MWKPTLLLPLHLKTGIASPWLVLMQGLLAFKGGSASVLHTISSGHNDQSFLYSPLFSLLFTLESHQVWVLNHSNPKLKAKSDFCFLVLKEESSMTSLELESPLAFFKPLLLNYQLPIRSNRKWWCKGYYKVTESSKNHSPLLKTLTVRRPSMVAWTICPSCLGGW